MDAIFADPYPHKKTALSCNVMAVKSFSTVVKSTE
jgi:hypothetical protein